MAILSYPSERKAACIGKHPYTTRGLAEKVAKRAREPVVSVYRCRFCSHWHIGSRLGPKRRPKAI